MCHKGEPVPPADDPSGAQGNSATQKVVVTAAVTIIVLLMLFTICLTITGNTALAATTGMTAAGLAAWTARHLVTVMLPARKTGGQETQPQEPQDLP